MRPQLLTILLIALPLVALESVAAEVVSSTSPPTAKTITNAQQPKRGMSMRQVERKFGTPEKKIAAAGKPPITRWVYTNFTVYFEDKYVIHAVKRRERPLKP